VAREVACPTCGKPVAWTEASRWRPFCSERCRLIDLGEWIDETRRIPADEERPTDESVRDAHPTRPDR
jgi:endogenous inhibitor of DNA gyrase (YacG/DUF329 family)